MRQVCIRVSVFMCVCYVLKLCKKIKKSGCRVLLIQKSILRDAVTDLSLHFLNKMKIMTITNIERDDIDFFAKVRFLLFFFHTFRRVICITA